MPRLSLLSNLAKRSLSLGSSKTPAVVLNCPRLYSNDPPEHHPPSNEPWIPEYVEKFEEPIQDKRNRLMYQSRKRGMLENGLLLGKSYRHIYIVTHVDIIQVVLLNCI